MNDYISDVWNASKERVDESGIITPTKIIAQANP